jgi:hypothetical protein
MHLNLTADVCNLTRGNGQPNKCVSTAGADIGVHIGVNSRHVSLVPCNATNRPAAKAPRLPDFDLDRITTNQYPLSLPRNNQPPFSITSRLIETLRNRINSIFSGPKNDFHPLRMPPPSLDIRKFTASPSILRLT